LGVKQGALWEVQWHPSEGGRVRRIVLTRGGLRRTLVFVTLILLIALVIVAALPLGLRGILVRFTVDAAQRDNRTLRLQGERLREEERQLAAAVIRRVQAGRRMAWVLGAKPGVWLPPCPVFPRGAVGDAAASRWFAARNDRLATLAAALSGSHDALRCPLSSIPFASPVDPRRAVPTSLFGWRVSPFTGKVEPHYGTTLAAPPGEPVLAPGGGRVLFAGGVRERRANEWTRLGNLVVLDHGAGVVTVYAHLRDTAVRRGQSVTRGQRLGSVGQTGWTRVPALYYEVRWPLAGASTPVDPGLVTPTLPVEDLDGRLADPTAGLPAGFAPIDHLLGRRSARARTTGSPYSLPAVPSPSPTPGTS
jgi:murein DD-endopeptidase MepM/ murein hydrolase activator NlpD